MIESEFAIPDLEPTVRKIAVSGPRMIRLTFEVPVPT